MGCRMVLSKISQSTLVCTCRKAKWAAPLCTVYYSCYGIYRQKVLCNYAVFILETLFFQIWSGVTTVKEIFRAAHLVFYFFILRFAWSKHKYSICVLISVKIIGPDSLLPKPHGFAERSLLK
jgi:hypothetical protein